MKAESILNDPYYLDCMQKIDSIRFQSDGKWDWEHGLGHASRVADYIVIILKQLKCDNETIELGKIAGLLHDIGLIRGSKSNHAVESSTMTKKYIKKFDLTENQEEILIQAILDHSKGDAIQSMIGMALVLADKLDVTYHRTIHSSIKDDMNQNIQKIQKVGIIMNENYLILNYTVLDNFNKYLLKEWDKCLTIPFKIAQLTKRRFIFKINDKEENYDFIFS